MLYRIPFAIAALLLQPPMVQAGDAGDPDPTFSADGKAWVSWPNTYVQAETTAVTTFPDGSVVTAGWVDRGNDNRDFAMTRFHENGELDTDFGNAGQQVVAFDLIVGGDDRALGVFDAGSGRTLVVGMAGLGGNPFQRPALLRLDASGQLDPSFGVGGKRVLQSQPFGVAANIYLSSAARAADGKLLLAGLCSNCGNGGQPDLLVLRLLSDGTPDSSFGNAGWASFGQVDGGGHYVSERATAVVSDPQGRVIVVGSNEYYDNGGVRHPLIVRFTNTGVLDTSFGGSGHVEINLLGSWEISAVDVQPQNGTIVVAMNTINMPAAVPAAMLMRIFNSGVVSTSFGGSGFADLTLEEGSHIDALKIRADLRIVAAGWIDPNGSGQRDFLVARILKTGDRDPLFDDNGVNRIAFDITADSLDEPRAMTLADGKPVIVGNAFEHVGPVYSTAVLRLQSDVSFANGFE